MRYTLVKLIERNRRALAAAGLTVTLAAAGTIWFAVNLEHARNEALRQEAKTRRMENFMLSLFKEGGANTGPIREQRPLPCLITAGERRSS